MQHITIVIPTRNRVDKLQRTITSIPLLDWIHTIIVCDGDEASYEYLSRRYEGDEYISIRLIKEHVGSVHARNSVIMKDIPDGLLYATDDIVFFRGAIEHAFEMFNETFPDDDGVVGFKQTVSHSPTGVALVGSAFLDRYKDRQLFCPNYFHFSCQEVHWHAERLNKFLYDRRAIIEHYHPIYFPNEMDETHNEARVYREQDHRLMATRRKAGLIWGYNG